MTNEKDILAVLRRIEEGSATIEDAQAAADWALNELSRAGMEQLDGFYRFGDLTLPDMLEQGAYLPAVLQRIMEVDRPATTIGDLKPEEAIDPGSVPRAHRIHFLKSTWFRYAAILLLIAGAGTLLYLIRYQETENQITVTQRGQQPDLSPGGNRAVLTLASGRKIALDSTQGNIITQGGLTVVNLSGELKYEGAGMATEYNTIATPKGGQYQIILPDGSKIWLNAASSIKFPTAFTGSERNVEMAGEAYMEITENSKQPFVVTANGIQIQVLGTSFNLNAYEDETVIKTTLINGRIKVFNGIAGKLNRPNNNEAAPVPSRPQPESVLLKPGQQAVVVPSGRQKGQDERIKIRTADLEQALAWKNGIFRFNQANMEEVMRQLARWYDIEVIYENEVSGIRLQGEIERNLTLTQMLDGLRELGVKFRLDGKRLILLQ